MVRATGDHRTGGWSPDMGGGRLVPMAMGAGFLVAALALGLLVYFDVHEEVLSLLEWLDAQGARALLLFILVMALVMVLLLPGLLFTAGAGFVFGVAGGSVAVVIGTTLGATLAFLIARYLFGARASNWVRSHNRLGPVSEELAAEGWKIVLLTRLVPFFPFKLSNYFFGLTRFSLRGFVGGTFLGVIPWSVHNVYLGSIAAELSGLGLREGARSPVEWGLYVAGFLATIVTVVYVNRLARRALSRHAGQAQG